MSGLTSHLFPGELGRVYVETQDLRQQVWVAQLRPGLQLLLGQLRYRLGEVQTAILAVA